MNRFSWIQCIRSCRGALESALRAVAPRQARIEPRPPCSHRPLSQLLAHPARTAPRRPDGSPCS